MGRIYLPNDLPDDLSADAKQHEEWGVGIVEAVQQNLGHLSLLLSYFQPGFNLKKYKKSEIFAFFSV